MPIVRLTLDPKTEVEVTEKELLDLQAWGLVLEGGGLTEQEAREKYGFGDEPVKNAKPRGSATPKE